MRNFLRKIINQEAGGIGYDVEIIYANPSIGQIGANNDLLSAQITLYISPKFEPDKVALDYLGKNTKEEALKLILADMVRHEIGHWEYPRSSGRGCPYDWFRAEEIFNGTTKGLGLNNRNVVGYVANAFMDVVDNTNVAYSRREFKGQVWFYYDQGKAVGKFSPFYDWFIRIQEDIWMKEEDKKLLKPFHNKNPIIEELEEKLFEELGLQKKSYNLDVLMNKDDWERQSEIYARIASKLLEKQPREMLTSGERIGKESGLERKMKDPNFLGKVIRKRWERGKEIPTYIDSIKSLSYLYRELAKDIPISVEAYTRDYAFPVVGYGRRESEEISRKIGINEKGEITFLKPKHWWEMEIPVKKSIGGVPNLYFIVDCSGSMQEGGGRLIPNAIWRDESKYHYVLLGIYGIRNYLERMRIIPSQIALTSFSTGSRSVISSFDNFKKVEEILFSPEFGTTYLPLQEISSTSKKLGKSVIIMLSDGEIHNWYRVRDAVKRIMGENYSAFISIIDKSSPFYDLRGVAKTFYVNKAEDLSKIMIKFTSKTYGELL